MSQTDGMSHIVDVLPATAAPTRRVRLSLSLAPDFATGLAAACIAVSVRSLQLPPTAIVGVAGLAIIGFAMWLGAIPHLVRRPLSGFPGGLPARHLARLKSAGSHAAVALGTLLTLTFVAVWGNSDWITNALLTASLGFAVSSIARVLTVIWLFNSASPPLER